MKIASVAKSVLLICFLLLLPGALCQSGGGHKITSFKEVVTEGVYFHTTSTDSYVLSSGKYVGNFFVFPVMFVKNTFYWIFRMDA